MKDNYSCIEIASVNLIFMKDNYICIEIVNLAGSALMGDAV